MGKFNDGERMEGKLKESWLRDNVELAAGGAILLGAARIGAKGEFSQVGRTAQRSTQAGLKAVDKYARRALKGPSKFFYNTGVKSARKLNQKKGGPPVSYADELLQKQKVVGNALNDEQTKNKIQREIGKQLDARAANVNRLNMEGRSGPWNQAVSAQEKNRIEANVFSNAAEHFQRGGKVDDLFTAGVRSSGADVAQKSGEKVKKMDQFVSNGLAGLGFGSGLTAIHAADRKLRNQSNDEDVEDSFKLVGSFAPFAERQNRFDDKKDRNNN